MAITLLAGVGYTHLPTKPDDNIYESIENELIKYGTEFNKPEFAIIIDYNRPIFKKRLWIINLETKEIELNTHVSHAWNSGFIKAKIFSNKIGSRISSKGTFKTLNSYESNYGHGKYKLGMRIRGLEKGKNDNVLKRNIVFHPSWAFWSSGCFMSLPWINKEIIELTKDGNIVIVN